MLYFTVEFKDLLLEAKNLDELNTKISEMKTKARTELIDKQYTNPTEDIIKKKKEILESIEKINVDKKGNCYIPARIAVFVGFAGSAIVMKLINNNSKEINEFHRFSFSENVAE